VLGR
jgi:hypothetical protein